ncbi:MAG: YsnF/AvaK protein [Candidatus Saccharibacteria bacterium]|jgi:uncharacterized membrane protein|nr:YsnF/AvaK protein [Candidatus Saccharibacteria bacterium]
MAKMLMAAFSSDAEADRALRELERHGYSNDDISVISKHDRYEDEGYSTGSDIAKGATGGAATGGVVGGLAGLLAGVGVFPALAGLFIGGPIAAALGLAGAAATTASGAITGAAAGGLIGALTSLGLSKESASHYDETVNRGGVVLGVNCSESAIDECRAMLEACNAQEIQTVTTRETAETHHEEHTTRPVRTEPAFGERRVESRREGDEIV